MNKLKKIRKDSGLTLVQLSNLCGVSKSRLSELEHGKTPSLDTAYKIGNFFSVTVYDIWEPEA